MRRCAKSDFLNVRANNTEAFFLTSMRMVLSTYLCSYSSTTKLVFNVDKFKEENEELYKQYEEEKTITSNGRAGYVKITLPKN